jgi:hypothetical protein|tara:strand:- start:839 stop:1807 length:969 start_codon:yes stop_codon:yes gene_type:complete
MAFYTQIDYSRQLKQSGATSGLFSGSSRRYGDSWVANPTDYSYNSGYRLDGYNGSSGYSFVVQTSNTLSGVTDYSDGRTSSYGVSITAYSGLSSGNTVLSIAQVPLLPVNPGATSLTLTASCLQIATGNLISSSSTDLGIDTLGNVVIDTSSKRFKDNIEDIEFENLDKLLALNPRKFKWKSNGSDDWGYIAEEVESLGLRDFVSYEGGIPHSVKYKKLTILLIAYLKKHGLGNTTTTKVSCVCPKEEFVVLTEDSTFILDHTKSTNYIIKSLASCNVEPDMGLIDSEWESLEMLPESCVGFRFYEPLSSWMIVSSDGIKES